MSKKGIFFIAYLCSAMFLFGTVLIDKAGNYKIPKDFVFSAPGPNNPAILINASNVTLDFQDHSLELASNNTFPGVDGIVVNNDIENVFIENININNVSGVGIHILDGCHNVNILNSRIKNCYAAGVFFDGSSSGTGISRSLIDNCCVTSCTGSEGNPAYGIRLANASINRISNSRSAFHDAGTTSSAYGIYIENTTSFEIKNSIIESVGGTNLVAGLAVLQSHTGYIDDVMIYNNTTRITGTSCGVFLDQSKHVHFRNCSSTANSSDESTIGFLSQNSRSNTFKNCSSELNIGDSNAAGFQFIAETGSNILNSLIQDQATLSSGTAYGIIFSSDCNQCWLMENKIANNIGINASYGIIDEHSSSTSSIIKNYAFNNGTNYSVTYPSTVTLPLLSASLSSDPPGIPTGVAGVFDNISINP